ncbi:MAG: hypothetical protein ACYCS1_05120 [Gammaproteobacteria bacterium]
MQKQDLDNFLSFLESIMYITLMLFLLFGLFTNSLIDVLASISFALIMMPIALRKRNEAELEE